MQQSWVSLLNSYNLILVVFRKDSKSWLFMEETAQQMKRPFGIPEKPEFTVGLDECFERRCVRNGFDRCGRIRENHSGHYNHNNFLFLLKWG